MQFLFLLGHDIEQDAIVGCGGDNCQEEFGEPPVYTKTSVAVMPKSPTASSSSNGWTAIGVCTFLVVVFATTTIYYWQKAKKMAKDMFANEKSGNMIIEFVFSQREKSIRASVLTIVILHQTTPF